MAATTKRAADLESGDVVVNSPRTADAPTATVVWTEFESDLSGRNKVIRALFNDDEYGGDYLREFYSHEFVTVVTPGGE